MSKRAAWFCVVKRFFGLEARPREEKGRRKWVFRLLKMKRLAPLSEPSSPQKIVVKTRKPLCSYESHDLFAIRIQAAFRGYLAREALRALKGVVKLQALIRGWIVRKQAINTLKCLQSIVNLQLEVCAKRGQKVMERLHSEEFYSQCFPEKDINVDLNSQKNRDVAKTELNVQKDRIIRDYLSHRRSAETERDKLYPKQRYWLEQWVDTQLAKSEANCRTGRQQLHPSELPNSNGARRSSHHYHHQKQHSTGDDIQVISSPSLPAYMAATESAKAKKRSNSTPRNRNFSFDVGFENNSPYMHGKTSPASSLHSEVSPSSCMRSPGLKALKATMSFKGV